LATKSNDLLGAALAFAAVVGIGLALKFSRERANGGAPASASSPTPAGAGGPYGGSWFAPEVQREWAVPDQQLPTWADL
jgi:hypothetical protein